MLNSFTTIGQAGFLCADVTAVTLTLVNQPNNEDAQVMIEKKCGEWRPPYRESKKIMTEKRQGPTLVDLFAMRCRLGKVDF